jgi:hypothetical protein
MKRGVFLQHHITDEPVGVLPACTEGSFFGGDMEKMALHAFQLDGVMEAIRREGSRRWPLSVDFCFHASFATNHILSVASVKKKARGQSLTWLRNRCEKGGVKKFSM